MKTRKFYLATFGIVIYSLLLTAISSYLGGDLQVNLLVKLILGSGIPIFGIFLMTIDNHIIYPIIGQHLVAISLGLFIAPYLNRYAPGVVLQASSLTMIITVFMGVLGYVKPNWFEGLQGPLFVALVSLILIRLIGLFFPQLNVFSWIDYVAAFIFSLYIGLDVYLLSKVPRTYSEAIRRGCSLYLDILNLFLSLLSIIDND
jgi:FtsH-binding integral membrane protein